MNGGVFWEASDSSLSKEHYGNSVINIIGEISFGRPDLVGAANSPSIKIISDHFQVGIIGSSV